MFGNLLFEKHFNLLGKPDKLEGATVVWTAPHPEKGGRAIVGVWPNATVYRERQEPSGRLAKRRRIGEATASFRCMAKAKDCLLVTVDTRPLLMRPGQPRNGESWPGQKLVFYPKPGSPALDRIMELLEEIGLPGTSEAKPRDESKGKKGRSAWQVDVERRRDIEIAAIKTVGLNLERLGFSVKLVEKDNLGYDLVATRNLEVLHVEVKGRSGKEISADLSANEYECLKRYQQNRNPNAHYRIAIVTDALVNPVVSEFVLVRGKKSEWCTLDGRWRLNFREHTAARLTANSILPEST